jgi:hypothetical protein
MIPIGDVLMSENMVESVARAIAAKHYDRRKWTGFCPKADRTAWLVNHYWDQFIPDARAAILAMKVPTAEMISAGEAAGIAGYDFPHPKEAWDAMISAALNPVGE